MGMEYLGDLIAEIRKARADLDGIIDNRDQRYIKRFDALEGSINEFYKKLNRPGAESTGADTDARKDAVDYCILKHAIAHPKADTAEVNFRRHPTRSGMPRLRGRRSRPSGITAMSIGWITCNVNRSPRLRMAATSLFCRRSFPTASCPASPMSKMSPG
jgi:hypothetical protein